MYKIFFSAKAAPRRSVYSYHSFPPSTVADENGQPAQRTDDVASLHETTQRNKSLINSLASSEQQNNSSGLCQTGDELFESLVPDNARHLLGSSTGDRVSCLDNMK
jgi:hypothetical protein